MAKLPARNFCNALIVLTLFLWIIIAMTGILPHRINYFGRRSFSCNFPVKPEHMNAVPLQRIHAITSTYARLTQKADLTRLIQTLMHLSNFHWILIEDSEEKTPLVTKLLQRSGLNYTHLNKKNGEQVGGVKDLLTRNAALAWVRENLGPDDGIVYFMDDDNTYDLRVFEDMRSTKVASIWPVALVGGLKVEGPVRCKNGQALTWRAMWKPNRTIPVDMAGFAISTALLRQRPDVNFVGVGDLESKFLGDLGLTRNQMEAKGNNCTEVYVWHTQTMKASAPHEEKAAELGEEYNPSFET
uniref:Galactosylgalactosylxylosylprotein 3-beta-glucuronosyltransferase n=1 Tax=Ciona intestinalis TaxID=7719 RepID=Q7YXB3_CIOIN|nr:3-beta-glucuronosyltransferase 2 [Ciona intestinalis]CAD98786.1 3-beta-glucuronosyltransferase [Ciona intestinalis]|eukprot:NP_001121585.1 3-beta-glucuronosyltransferase 2 [Ciona intestinalis]